MAFGLQPGLADEESRLKDGRGPCENMFAIVPLGELLRHEATADLVACMCQHPPRLDELPLQFLLNVRSPYTNISTTTVQLIELVFSCPVRQTSDSAHSRSSRIHVPLNRALVGHSIEVQPINLQCTYADLTWAPPPNPWTPCLQSYP